MTDTPFNARLSAIADIVSQRRLPPVSQWQPTRTGDIDIRIARDGSWYYRGTRIERPALVRLFSTVLRCDEQGDTWLVTPVEKLRIVVEDAPFTAVLLDVAQEGGQATLSFTTNVGDIVTADAEHPVTVNYAHAGAEPAPYVRVRDRLRALISRSVFIELGTLAVVEAGRAGVYSNGCFMPLDEAPA